MICPKFGDTKSNKIEKVKNKSENNIKVDSSISDKLDKDTFEDETQDNRPEPR